MELQQYWLTFKRHRLPALAVFGSVATLTVLTLMIQRPVFQAEGKLRYTKADSTSSLTGLLEGQVGELDPLVEENNPISTEIEVIKSVPTIQGTIDRLELKDSSGHTLKRQDFLERLEVLSNRGTDIVEINYQDHNPELAATVVDTLMMVYLEKYLAENRAETVAAREFIEQQLPAAERNVDVADAKLRQFKEANNIAALEEEASAIVTAAEDLNHSIAEVQAELASVNAQSAGFSQELGMSPQTAIAAAALSQSPGVQQALTTLQEVEAELAAERVRFQDGHPSIQALLTRKANLTSLLDQRIQATLRQSVPASAQNLQIGELRAELIGDFIRTDVERRGLASELSTMARTYTAYRDRIGELPRLEQQQRELERELDAAQSTYSLLLERLHEIRIAENQTVGNARVIQHATVLEEPISPRPLAHLVTGLMLGLMGAIATALVLESSDKSIRTIKEIKTTFGLPILGIIPLNSQPQSRVSSQNGKRLPASVIVQEEPMSQVSEAYRVLQSNLLALASRQAIKAFAVTSSVPGEGKSFVSSNLAMAIAQLKHRVLLIDADMRCPNQHMIWHVDNAIGLGHVLSEHQEPRAAIQSVAPFLDLMPAGTLPENPSALLDSPDMNRLLEDVSSEYDLVIIDTPALNIAADVLLLGHKTNGILFVARSGVVDGASAGLAKEHLEQSDLPVLGIVVNGVTLEHEPYSTYDVRPDLLELNSLNYRQLVTVEKSQRRDAA